MSAPPPTLPADEAEVEKLTRAGLVALFTGIEGLPHVAGEAEYIEGETEYVRRFGFPNPASKKTEYRLLEIIFSDFDDLAIGCDDDPAYKLKYTINLLIQFSPLAKLNGGPSAVSSTDDFARIVLALRRKVLRGRHVAGFRQLRAENLKVVASRFGPDDELKLRAAHFAQFSLGVEVTPTPQPAT